MKGLSIGVVVMLTLGAPVAASAGPAEACVASLSPQAKMIYDAVRAAPEGDLSLRDQIKAQTRHLVQTGCIERSGARPAAMAAGGCLKQVEE